MTANPNLKSSFTTTVRSQTVDKLDLLFMIDNSASMGDKQKLLAQAIPDMIRRLVTPNCVDPLGAPIPGVVSDETGKCASGKAEFPPVHDMHIGIVSSSLGARGGNVCDPAMPNKTNPTLNAHQDDRGELIARGDPGGNGGIETEQPVPSAGALDFLAWFPPVQANAGAPPPPVPAETDASTLIGDFAQMITGVHEHGCGYEAQNEAWYRFLVQPDPYDAIVVENNRASYSGVDATILKQRAAFLRPDSLLAVIVVTDENEQVDNPLAIGGSSYLFENYPFDPQKMLYAPEGTVECGRFQNAPGQNPGPDDPSCTSCALISASSPTFSQRCPDDPKGGSGGFLAPEDDPILLRFFDEKQRFGVTARYPISRYVTGLQSFKVPDRDHEQSGEAYAGDENANCVNPLYAEHLPTDPSQDLCNLQPGPRTPDQVFYAAIAGVPHQLLQAHPGDPECPTGTAPADCPQKAELTPDDWRAIIGNDPIHYDFSGMDFHMLESPVPRAGSSCTPPGAGDTCDPVNGREWDSKGQDLEYACTFPFEDPTSGDVQPKDCSLPQFDGVCDCETTPSSAPDLGAPLCQKDPATGKYTALQIAGKAYPSAREMQIAHALATNAAIGNQGIVSSLCPIHTHDVGGTADPLYGYRPAVNAIVDRLKNVLNVQCLPERLTVQADGTVPCLLLAEFRGQTGGETFCASLGLQQPDGAVLSRFRQAGNLSPDVPVCVLHEIPSDPGGQEYAAYQACSAGDPLPQGAPGGWCYVSGTAAGKCPQEILFTPNQPPSGAFVTLQCIEQTSGVVDGGT